MKNMVTGDKALKMMKNAEHKYTERKLITDDPWWGKLYETIHYMVIEGKTYKHIIDRDGWDTLIEVGG